MNVPERRGKGGLQCGAKNLGLGECVPIRGVSGPLSAPGRLCTTSHETTQDNAVRFRWIWSADATAISSLERLPAWPQSGFCAESESCEKPLPRQKVVDQELIHDDWGQKVPRFREAP